LPPQASTPRPPLHSFVSSPKRSTLCSSIQRPKAHTPTGTRKTRPLTKARSASGRENHPEKKLQAARNFFGQFFHEHPKEKKKGKKKRRKKWKQQAIYPLHSYKQASEQQRRKKTRKLQNS
jgi:hypothetical protein